MRVVSAIACYEGAEGGCEKKECGNGLADGPKALDPKWLTCSCFWITLWVPSRAHT